MSLPSALTLSSESNDVAIAIAAAAAPLLSLLCLLQAPKSSSKSLLKCERKMSASNLLVGTKKMKHLQRRVCWLVESSNCDATMSRTCGGLVVRCVLFSLLCKYMQAQRTMLCGGGHCRPGSGTGPYCRVPVCCGFCKFGFYPRMSREDSLDLLDIDECSGRDGVSRAPFPHTLAATAAV